MISFRRISFALWCGLALVWLAVMLVPISITLIRLAAIAGLALLWLGALAFLLWRSRRAFIALLLVGVIPGLWLLLPGRDEDTEELRVAYVHQLSRYQGTPYVWGGENRLGIDCSGLVRRALIHANLERGLLTLNPAPVRRALSMTWHDCTAMDLRDGATGLTHWLGESRSINTLDQHAVLPGTLAVTRNGVHVLAYLGGGRWIQASPAEGRVITLLSPSEDSWFGAPVVLVEWAELRH